MTGVLRSGVLPLRRLSLLSLAVAALLGAREAAAGPFARGPFLQSLGPNGVTIKVELLTPEAVSVEITGPDGAVKKAGATDARRFQSVRIEGLSPGTTYRYKVVAGDKGETSDEGQFVTAPVEPKPFKFIIYGDSRSDPESHAAVIRAIQAEPSDFLVHTGDMVATGDEEDDWRSFFDVENKLLRDRCMFATIGNHELTGEKGVGANAFLRYFAACDEKGQERPQLYGSFRWSNARFFLLNAMDDWSGEERAWLKDALDASAREPGLVHRFAVLHHGPQSSGPHGGNPRLHKNGVMQIFRDGKVDLIIAGHDHAYERGTAEGIKYIISGGAGAPIYPRRSLAPETAVYEPVHHFVEVSVSGEDVGIVVKRASGSVLEACGFSGDAPWDCDKAKAAAPSAPKAASHVDAQGGNDCLCSAPGEGPAAGGVAVGLAVAAGLLGRRARRKPAAGSADRARA